jgi:hypothetical protein
MRLHPPQIALRNPNNGAAGGPLASGAGNVPVSPAIAIASRFIGPGPSGAENLEPVCYSYHTTESTGQAARYARRVNRGQDTIHVPTYAVVLVRQRFKPGPAHYNKWCSGQARRATTSGAQPSNRGFLFHSQQPILLG